MHRAQVLLLVWAIFAGAARFQAARAEQPRPKALQAQVLALQGGIGPLVRDASGLVLPPHPQAVSWLQEFWETGSSRTEKPPPLLSPSPAQRETRWSQLVGKKQQPQPACSPNRVPVERRNLLVVPAGDSWTADKYATPTLLVLQAQGSCA